MWQQVVSGIVDVAVMTAFMGLGAVLIWVLGSIPC
jgi:hypothetical protein